MQLDFFIGTDKIASGVWCVDYQVTLEANPNYNNGKRELVVTGTSGREYLRVEVSDCNYIVTCDDNCPPGHIKCECDSYPGYCCIPCSEIRSEISSATATLRRINHG
ncbi:MAG: hypothetical protein KME52_28745 [Desmonostoc geniculatum HA4340-LM1]|nr:hypothetical protein [Desmonostoc geniculatum HA4340-LM1]